MTNIILCGCGALGSHITMNIANENTSFYLIDDDRVGNENVFNGTSAYTSDLIGKTKPDALSLMLYRKYQVKSIPRIKTVNSVAQIQNAPFGADLLIDAFDNIEARSYTVATGTPALHVSIGEHGIGAIEWDEVFELPSEGFTRGENPVCTNELGRNLILFTSMIASVIINKYLSTGVKESVYVDVNKLEIYR